MIVVFSPTQLFIIDYYVCFLPVSSYLQRPIYLPWLKESHSGSAPVRLLTGTKHLIIISRRQIFRHNHRDSFSRILSSSYCSKRGIQISFPNNKIKRFPPQLFFRGHFFFFPILRWDVWICVSCCSNWIGMNSNWIWRDVFCYPERKEEEEEVWDRAESSGEGMEPSPSRVAPCHSFCPNHLDHHPPPLLR